MHYVLGVDKNIQKLANTGESQVCETAKLFRRETSLYFLTTQVKACNVCC